MKLLLWACKKLGYQTLQRLQIRAAESHQLEIVAVVISRKDVWSQPITELLKGSQVPLFHDQDQLMIKADVGLCIGFPEKLTPTTLFLCRQGVINLHFAPLPAYRGSGTLTWAIINQEKEFGVTLHWMDEKLDTGPIIQHSYFPLATTLTVRELEAQLEQHAWQFLQGWLPRIACGELPAGKSQAEITQETGLTPHFYTRASVKKLYHLSVNWPAEKIVRYLRALPQKKELKPYFVFANQRVLLELEDISHHSHT